MTSGPIPLGRPRNGRGPSSAAPRRTLRVGDLAKQTGKTVRALHLYEELGLLEPAERSKGGYRLYYADSVLRVSWITKLQDMGFSLSEIKAIVRQFEGSDSAPSAMHQMEAVFRDRLSETRAQMKRLRQLESELEASLDYLQACGTCDPRRLLNACGSCELHEAAEEEPDLVAGFRPQQGVSRT